MHEQLFAVVCDGSYFPGLQALLHSIRAYHGSEIAVQVYSHGLDAGQLRWLQQLQLPVSVCSTRELPFPAPGTWEAKQQVFAHQLGKARRVCLLDADLVLTSRLDDLFAGAAAGRILSSADGTGITFGPEYAVYGPQLVGKRQVYINSGLLCLDVLRHWELAGLWAFAAQFGAYSPGGGAPLSLPGHGDQGVFNAVAALLDKESQFQVLPEGTWCDSTRGCSVRIVGREADGRLDVWNDTENARQRLVHCTGAKWWTGAGVSQQRRFGDKLAVFHHFAGVGAAEGTPSGPVAPYGIGGGEPGSPRILVGICSCHQHAERREAVRKTWLRELPEQLTAVFFVGQGGACPEPGVVRLPVPDDYGSLSTKVLSFYRYALQHYDFDYLFKCDDDTYVHPERLLALPSPDVDFVGSSQLPQERYASGGAGYLLSRRLLKAITRDAVPNQSSEDVIFSRRALESGLPWRSTELLHGFGEQFPERGNEIVTGHWCPPAQLERLHTGLAEEYLPQPLLLRARHTAWSGSVRLYPDGTFLSRGGALPDGRWSTPDQGATLVLNWHHWPAESLALHPWGFAAPDFQLTFALPEGLKAWESLRERAPTPRP